MAVRMKEHTVFYAIRTTFASPDQMVTVPPRDLGDFLVAHGAETSLFLPQIQEPSFAGQVPFHFNVKTFLKVRFPGRVKRVCCSLYGSVPLDFHIYRSL